MHLHPFGGWPRRRIGAASAMMGMKAVLSTMIRRVKLTAPDRRPESPRTRHVTQVRGRGGWVVALQR